MREPENAMYLIAVSFSSTEPKFYVMFSDRPMFMFQ